MASVDELPVEEAGTCKLPPVTVPRCSIILGPIDLLGGKLEYKTLDMMAELGIDLTALRWTRTEGGNAFRQYRLFTS